MNRPERLERQEQQEAAPMWPRPQLTPRLLLEASPAARGVAPATARVEARATRLARLQVLSQLVQARQSQPQEVGGARDRWVGGPATDSRQKKAYTSVRRRRRPCYPCRRGLCHHRHRPCHHCPCYVALLSQRSSGLGMGGHPSGAAETVAPGTDEMAAPEAAGSGTSPHSALCACSEILKQGSTWYP